MRWRRLPVAALVVAMLAGCDEGSPGDLETTDGPIGYPTGASDVVLRIRSSGGLPPPWFEPADPPWVSVYGDGRVVWEEPGPAGPPFTLARFSEGRIDHDGMLTLLDEARRAGLLEEGLRLHIPGAYDIPFTSFEVLTDAGTHSVVVTGLGLDIPGIPAGQGERRRAILRFMDLLLDEQGVPRAEVVGPSRPFAFERARVWVREVGPAGGGATEVPWPLARPLASLGEPTEGGGVRTDVVGGGSLDRIVEAMGDATVETVWTEDGIGYELFVSPLLPDEVVPADEAAD